MGTRDGEAREDSSRRITGRGFDPLDLRAAELLVRGEPRTVEDLLELGERVLRNSGCLDREHDHAAAARALFQAAVRRPIDVLPPTSVIPRLSRERYLAFIARRAGGEPVGLIRGHVEFAGLDIRLRQGLFVPRPSSEFLVERALARLSAKPPFGVIDVGTGSGAIALAIAKRAPHAEVWGVDISPLAVRQAAANARRLGLRARFRLSDVYSRLPRRLRQQVDVIVAYAPYLSAEDVGQLPSEVREFEPLSTLLDLSDDRLSLLRIVVTEAAIWLRPGGWVLIQIDPDTSPAIAELYEQAGLREVNTRSHESSWDVIVEGRGAP